jgi:hypothetical protein
MFRHIVPILAVLSGAPLAVAQHLPPDDVQLLRWVETADPVADAKKAAASNDFRLLAVHGYTWTIPGVSEDKKFEYEGKYGLRMIEGTSDVVMGPEHERLIRAATQYAKRYNSQVLDSAGSR